MDDRRRAKSGRREWFALTVVLVALVLFPATLFGYQAVRTRAAGVRVIDVVARVPDLGGFSPDRLQLRAGETVRLRLSSPDVVHGFTIPGLGVDVGEIYPGKVVEVDITPQKAGRYAFACTRWCGADHWRMRGVIEVAPADGAPGDGDETQPEAQEPLFQRLGLDIDAPRHAARDLPAEKPSAARGASLGAPLPAELADPGRRRALSPVEEFQLLRNSPEAGRLDDQTLWDTVAWAWLRDATPQDRTRAVSLYARDCAACHGPDGKGDGPAGVDLRALRKMQPDMPAGPADLTDPAHMLAASDALLQGKILRGGMGTGMPEFGSLYTDEELWAMVAYVRSFLLND